MKFQRYSKIIPPSKIEVNPELSKETKWVIQEKIHGANFSFLCDGKKVIPCKRSGYVQNPFKFFRSDIVLMEHSHQVLRVFRETQYFYEKINKSPRVTSIQLFGELFGGRYPHEDVFNSLNKNVQPEVFYHPSIKFIAFDCLVTFDDNTSLFMTPLDLSCLLNDLEIKIGGCCTRVHGTLKEALEKSKETFEAESRIRELYGLPQIEGNIREGNIIRPYMENILVDGTPFIVKHKNRKFKEKHLGSIQISLEDLSAEARECYTELLQSITWHRIDSMIGKVGEDTKRYKEICGRLLREIEEEAETKMLELDKQTQRFIRRTLVKDLEMFVLQRFAVRATMNQEENA